MALRRRALRSGMRSSRTATKSLERMRRTSAGESGVAADWASSAWKAWAGAGSSSGLGEWMKQKVGLEEQTGWEQRRPEGERWAQRGKAKLRTESRNFIAVLFEKRKWKSELGKSKMEN